MIPAIWTIAKLDLLMWKRMPLAILSAILPPIGMTCILVTLSLAVLQQPIALVVKGQGQHSQKMQEIIQSDTDAYINSDFTDKVTPTDEHTARNLLKNQQVAAIITIPLDFDKKVAQGHANVHLLLNNVDIDFADDIRRSVDRSVAHFNAPTRSQSQKNPFQISIDEEDLRKTNVEWLQYQVIPALVLLVLSVGLIGTALLCGQDIERKTARYLVLTPQRTGVLVAGRLLGGILASLIALIPAIVLCKLMGVIDPPPTHWPALIAIFVATAICASGLGAIIGTTLHGSKTIAMASSVIASYMFFLGGGFTTIAFLPHWLQTISTCIPIRYAIDGMRQALFYPTLEGVWMDITILSITALLAICIGSYTVRRSWINA